jgi:hypothetical protein
MTLIYFLTFFCVLGWLIEIPLCKKFLEKSSEIFFSLLPIAVQLWCWYTIANYLNTFHSAAQKYLDSK